MSDQRFTWPEPPSHSTSFGSASKVSGASADLLRPYLEQGLGDRYRIHGVAGQGGMGVVYRASAIHTGQDVALKVMHGLALQDPAEVARFEREAHIATQMNHPNIVKSYGVHRLPEGLGLVLVSEFLDGGTLQERLRNAGPPPVASAAYILRQLAAALAYAHSRGVVHRDVTPDNVYFAVDGTVKLGDFGIARAQDSVTLTGKGETFGKPQYMSPEQIRGESLDAQTDIFSFGVVAWELLTGQSAWGGGGVFKVIERRQTVSLADVQRLRSDVPVPLAAVIARCLESRIAERYEDGTALGRALGALDKSDEASRPAWPSPPPDALVEDRTQRWPQHAHREKPDDACDPTVVHVARPIATSERFSQRSVMKEDEWFGERLVLERAWDELNREGVVLKRLTTSGAGAVDASDAFRRDFEIGRTVAHGNLWQCRETVLDQHGTVVQSVWEYVGDPLRDALSAGGLPIPMVRKVLRDVARGLGALHRYGFVHRGITPESVLLRDDGSAVLGDFGLSQLVGAEARGSVSGDPAYMSPEQLAMGVVDERSDLYALGLLGWEMLTSVRPWSRHSLHEVVAKQMSENLLAVSVLRSDVPRQLEALVQSLLHKDPSQRPSSTDQVVALLDGTAVATGASASVAPIPQEHAARDATGRAPVDGRASTQGDVTIADFFTYVLVSFAVLGIAILLLARMP